MGADCLTLRQAWRVYDRWLDDPRVEMRREPGDVDGSFRRVTTPLLRQSSPKAVGDCYLLALAQTCSATVVTLDGGLFGLGTKMSQEVLLLA